MQIQNIAAYRFVSLDHMNLYDLRETLRSQLRKIGLKGTILLSPEGINLFLAGDLHQIDQLKTIFNQYPEFDNLYYKTSPSAAQPFKRMLVKVKKEIISLGQPQINPAKYTSPYLDPAQLKAWYQAHEDFVILDTRNDYEIAIGAFQNAIDLHIKNFRDFPEAIKKLPEELKNKKLVTYCTGGIRCEKAAPLLEQAGFKNVYQLQGGILDYFEKCGGDFYFGECFVFDQRVAVDANLSETETVQCFGCRNPLNLTAQQQYPDACPHCQTSGELRG